MNDQYEPPAPPSFQAVVVSTLLLSLAPALMWWSYQAFVWLRTGKVLDWYFGTFLLIVERIPDNSPAYRVMEWAKCSGDPLSAVPGCNGVAPWAGLGKIVNWWLSLDVGLGIFVTAVGLGIVFGRAGTILMLIVFGAHLIRGCIGY